MRIAFLINYKKVTGAAAPALLLAKQLARSHSVVVFALGGSVKRFCERFGVEFQPLKVSSLRELKDFDRIFTLRSKETLLALVFAPRKKIFRLNFTDTELLYDRFIRVVPLSILGWTDSVSSEAVKDPGRILVVGRLKKNRGFEDLFDRLRLLRVKPSLFVVGEGELKESLRKSAEFLRFEVKFLGRVRNLKKVMAESSFLLYPLSGTDKSSRTVLEAMGAGAVVFSGEPRTAKYIEPFRTGFLSLDPFLFSWVFLNKALSRRISLNALKRARRFDVAVRADLFSSEPLCEWLR